MGAGQGRFWSGCEFVVGQSRSRADAVFIFVHRMQEVLSILKRNDKRILIINVSNRVTSIDGSPTDPSPGRSLSAFCGGPYPRMKAAQNLDGPAKCPDIPGRFTPDVWVRRSSRVKTAPRRDTGPY